MSRRVFFPILVLALAAMLLWVTESEPPREAVEPEVVRQEMAPTPPQEITFDQAQPVRAPVMERLPMEESGDRGADLPEEADGAYQALLRFRIEPESFLDRATAWVIEPSWDGRPAKARLSGDAVRMALMPGPYQVFLDVPLSGPSFAKYPRSRLRAGAFVMPAADHEETFDLGRARSLRGRVTAAGEAVHPGTLRLSDGDHEVCQVPLGTDGSWLLPAAPAAELVASVLPRDPLLWDLEREGHSIPADSEVWDLELPAGIVHLALEDPGAWPGGRLALLRSPLPGVQAVHRPGLARVEGLDERVLQLRILPSLVQLLPAEAASGTTRLEPSRFEVRSAEIQTVALRIVRQGRVSVAFDGVAAGLHGDLVFQAESHPRQLTTVSLPEAGFMSAVYAVDPGRTELRLRGPFLIAGSGPPRYWSDAQAQWSVEIEVEADRHLLVRLPATPGGKSDFEAVWLD